MKINYKGEEVNVSMGVGSSDNDTAISIRYSNKALDSEENIIDINLGSNIFTYESGDEKDRKFVNDLRNLIQEYTNLKEQ
jgi:hypothetical protein